jgi:wyosine [tRNA(Phe)-imidazoG37] synthetase (radical SAM superfamily)
MLRFEDIVFGPIRSRRLGSSLGVNILPAHGKMCNFDCVYCECGWNRDGAGDKAYPRLADVAAALEKRLAELSQQGIPVDSITFSGNGEPTMNPDFAAIVDKTIQLRDRFYPSAKVSVLSNATMVGRESVFDALKKVDNAIMKIDASTDELIEKVNKPTGVYRLETVIEGLKKFEGNFVLQTMFLRSDEFDTAAPEALDRWMDIVRELRPREIMVYTIDRETPDKTLGKYTVEQMTQMVRPLMDEGFDIQIRG